MQQNHLSLTKCENHLFLVLSHLDDLKGQNIFPFTHRYTFRVLHLAHTYFPRELLFQSTLIFIERKYRKCEKIKSQKIMIFGMRENSENFIWLQYSDWNTWSNR